MRARIAIGIGAVLLVAAASAVFFDVGPWVQRDEGGLIPSGDGAAAPPSSVPDWTAPGAEGEWIEPASPAVLEHFGVKGADVEVGFDVTIHVDPESGADSNTGMAPEDRLATLGAATQAAGELRSQGQRVRILLAPGIYRQDLRLSGDEEDAPLLLIQAEQRGTAVVTGADAWTDWVWDESVEAFVHSWPYDWGGFPGEEEIVGRRELLVVDDTLLEQVLRLRDLDDGTFFVDEAADRLYMRPPRGSSFPSLTAEVAVRSLLMQLDGVRNVVVSGLVFRHAANTLDATAVRVTNSENVVFDHNEVVENNWTGFGLSTSERITVSNNTINRNGGGGAGLFKASDVLFTGNDTSFNNWRGVRGDYLGWSIAGVKAVGASFLTVHRHRAWGNQTRGLWIDYDISNVAILDSTWCDNRTDGLFLEAVQGPVVVSNVEACNNGRYGMLLVNLYGTTIEDSVVCGNAEQQIHMDTERGGREVTTASGTVVLSAARDLTLRRNVVAGEGVLLRLSIPQADFDGLVGSLVSEENTWSGSSTIQPFGLPEGDTGIEGWQSATGQDADSTWDTNGADFECVATGS
jgi:parallel beta-helix repeat protein